MTPKRDRSWGLRSSDGEAQAATVQAGDIAPV